MASIDIPISRTKVIIPALRPEVLHRARLLARFDDLLEKKLILITAPAGYGKTSLLVDFSRQSGLPVCWLSLDSLDKDPQRFIAYLIAALAERFPTFGKRSNAVLKTVTSFDQDSERLLSSLVNEMTDQIDQHFALVLDDYQFVDFIPAIRDLFSRFVSLAGENCHVILASRRLPTLPDITLMVARQQVSGFDFEELAFLPDEIQTLFRRNYAVSLDDAATSALVHQTEGWITGLLLSTPETNTLLPDHSSAAMKASRSRTSRSTGVDLAVYLDQQVLSHQPPDLRQFLLQTSLLEEFDADLCEAVLGAGDWKKQIEKIRHNSLFVLPVGPHGKWLRYHHLFGEFLQARMFEESAGTANAILARLAKVFEERHDWEKAYAIMRQLGNPDALAELVERIGAPVLISGHLVTLQTWLDVFPAALLEKRPGLLSLKGAFLCGLGDGRTAIALLDRAIQVILAGGDASGLALAYVRRAAARRLVGDYAGAVQDADDALRSAGSSPDSGHVSAEALRFQGICQFRLSQPEQALALLEDSLQRYQQLGESESIARLQMDLGWVYQSKGDLPAAAECYRQALAEWKHENNLYSQVNVLNNLAVLKYIQGDYKLAVRTLEEGLTCARHGAFHMQEALLLASLGDVLSDIDEFESAHQVYAKALVLAQRTSYQFLVNYLVLVQVRLARLRGRLQEAHLQLQAARPLVQAGGSNYESGLLYLESGCLSLEEGNIPAACSELQNALDQFERGTLTAEAGWSRLWLAAARARSGEKEVALGLLQSILNALPQEAGDPPLVHMLRHAAPWLAELEPDPVATSLLNYVSQATSRLPLLRRQLRRMLKAAPLQASRLTIQALGKPQVRVNGKLVGLSQWQSLSVRNLFFFFLLSSRPVTKEEIGEIFWPENTPAQLKLSFKNNLYRLRRALGQDVVLFEENRYFFNRHLDYEYDVEDFDSHLSQAHTASLVEDKLVHLGNAVKIWHGPFLQDLGATWAWPERQRLENACLEALRQLAELHHQVGDWKSALQVCQRALEINPCTEDAHRLAMRIHAERGDRLAVIWQYQACQQALHKLDMLPSKETQALYQHLVA
jgi:LuxR family maltose regulon positive regulatory protein